MALNPSQQWWIRIAGNELNGGGFDASVTSPGTNRADSDSAHVTFNGTSVTAVTAGVSPTITITGYTVLTADVGNTLRISAGTNFDPGYYTIVSVNTGANTWTLDRDVASGVGAAMEGRMGGAHAGLINYSNGGSGSAPVLATPLIAGNIINVRGTTAFPSAADYTQTSYYTFPQGDDADGQIRLRGYNGRPAFTGTDTLVCYQLTNWTIEGIAFLASGAGFTNIGIVNGLTIGMGFDDCYFDQAGFDTCIVSGARCITNSLFANTGGGSAGTLVSVSFTNPSLLCQGVVFRDQLGSAVNTDSGAGSFINCIFTRGVTSAAAVMLTTPSGTTGFTFANCVFEGNGGDGIDLSTSGAVIASRALNCIFSNNGGYGINASVDTAAVNDRRRLVVSDYNAFFSNGAGEVNGLSDGPNDVTLSGDPFTNAAADDFSLNNTAGAGAACREAAFPGVYIIGSTTGYLDIGAAQHQGGGGGGTTFVGIIGGV